MARQTLEQWVVEAVNDPDKPGPCSGLALMHMVAGGGVGEEVHSIQFGGSEWTPKKVADLFRHKAEGRAQDLTGVQQFQVWAFYDKRTEPQAKFPLTITGRLDFDGSSTEGPTNTGLASQAMRHSEAVMQLAFRQTSMLFEMQARTMQMLSDQNASLARENIEAFNALKEAAAASLEGRMSERRELLEYERSSQERAALMKFLPALVNTVAGSDVFPASTADSSLVESIASRLDEEKLSALVNILPPEVMGPIASRVTQILEAKRKSAERISEISQRLDPEVEQLPEHRGSP